MSDEAVSCPNCGAPAEPIEGGTFTDPEEVAVDKIVFDGEARWVEFDDELVYQKYRCGECDREVRQIRWDGDLEPPVLVPETAVKTEPDGACGCEQ
jgi:DNA-directed RNA polymerase subunit RPC12/RpoP